MAQGQNDPVLFVGTAMWGELGTRMWGGSSAIVAVVTSQHPV